MITVMVAKCVQDMEDMSIWEKNFTDLAKKHNREIELKFVEDIIEVGFFLHMVDIIFMSADFKEYESDLQAMADKQMIICLEENLKQPFQLLQYIEEVLPIE